MQVLGITAIVLSGLFNGSFTYPMKLVSKWAWENIWLAFGLFGLVLLPVGYAFMVVPGLVSVYESVTPGTLVAASLLGVAWGTGSLLFGLAVSALGMSLGYAITMGATAVFGTLVPAIVLEPGILSSGRGLRLMASLIAIIAGLILCGVAGRRREALAPEGDGPGYRILTKTAFRKGIAISIFAGVFSACFNIGYALTDDIAKAAMLKGASPANATFSIWAIIMSSGFVPSLIYCLRSFRRNHTILLFRGTPANWFRALAMGFLWIGGVKLYGSGTTMLGSGGAMIGWPILMAFTIITANGLGFVSGEWRRSNRAILKYLYAGLGMLIGAVILAGSAAKL
jgi:L-rhamnose-H+ transport protein